MSSAPLILIKCMPSALNNTVSPSSARQTLLNHLTQTGILPPNASLEDFTRRLYRIILAPYPLTLSIGAAFLEETQEVFIDNSVVDPSDKAVKSVDGKAWLREQRHASKFVNYWGKDTLNYCFNFPPDSYAIAVVTTLFADRASERSSVRGTGFNWPNHNAQLAVDVTEYGSSNPPIQAVSDEDKATYVDDETAARVQVRMMREVKELVEKKMKEGNRKVESLLPDIKYQMSQLPDLPHFPRLELGSDTSLQSKFRVYSNNSQQLLSELQALKSRLASRH